MDSAKKRQIIECTASIRETARFFNVSPTTVWMLRKENSSSELKISERFEVLPNHLRQLLAEFVRLSRFPQKRWMEFLSEILPAMPTPHAKKAWENNKEETPGTSPRSLMWSYKHLNKEVHKELGIGRFALVPKPGIWAAHRIRVEWERTISDGKTKETRAEILCLIERETGMLYLKGFERLQPSGITESIFRFFTICPIEINTLVFVSKTTKGRTVSTAGTEEEKNLKDMLGAREEFYEADYEVEVEVPLGRTAGKKILLPWNFSGLTDLNQQLTSLVNRYNTARRVCLAGGDSWRLLTPRERLWEDYKGRKELVKLSRSRFDRWTTLSKHAKLQRSWYKE